MPMTTADAMNDPEADLAELIIRAKAVAVRYRRLTGKPLGVSGEVAEYEVARVLGLNLSPARTQGYDAVRSEGDRTIRYQIKGRAVDPRNLRRGRVPTINLKHEFDFVLLALLNQETLDLVEIWQTSRELVQPRLEAPGSRARNERGSLGITQFISIAEEIWEADRRQP
jgi:hypothetical protein